VYIECNPLMYELLPTLTVRFTGAQREHKTSVKRLRPDGRMVLITPIELELLTMNHYITAPADPKPADPKP